VGKEKSSLQPRVEGDLRQPLEAGEEGGVDGGRPELVDDLVVVYRFPARLYHPGGDFLVLLFGGREIASGGGDFCGGHGGEGEERMRRGEGEGDLYLWGRCKWEEKQKRKTEVLTRMTFTLPNMGISR
jgi:hypothetical protein